MGEHCKKTLRPEYMYLRVRLEFARPVASFSVAIFKTVLHNCVTALAGTVGSALHDIDVLSYRDGAGNADRHMASSGSGADAEGREAVLRVKTCSAELVQAAFTMCVCQNGVPCRIAVVGGPTPFLMALASPRFL